MPLTMEKLHLHKLSHPWAAPTAALLRLQRQAHRGSRCLHHRVTAAASVSQDAKVLYGKLADAEMEVRRAPPSEKQDASAAVLEAMTGLKEGGLLKKWGAELEEPFSRRNVFLGELKRVGVLNPSAIGVASIRERTLEPLLGISRGSAWREKPMATSCWQCVPRPCLYCGLLPGNHVCMPSLQVTTKLSCSQWSVSQGE